MKTNQVYLGLGSNLGNREQYLLQAMKLLEDNKQIRIKKVSSIYETAPIGYLDQGAFLNMVVEIETTLAPLDLLEQTSKVENTLNRKREIHWGPRTMDVDILLYNQELICEDTLIVPHPRMAERAFVLIPLLEIAPTLTFPGTGKKINQLLSSCQGGEGVHLKKAFTMIK